MPTRTQVVEIKLQTKAEGLGVFDRVRGKLDELKQAAGSRSGIKDAFELLKGGGAVAGMTFAAGVLKDMAQSAVKLKDEFKAGKISAGEMTEELIKATPVIGRIWDAGRAIRELIIGEEAAIRGTVESAERMNAWIDTSTKAAKLYAQHHRENIATIAGLRREIQAIGATSYQQKVMQIEDSTRADITTQSTATQQKIDAAWTAEMSRRTAARAEIQARREELAALQPTAPSHARGYTAQRIKWEKEGPLAQQNLNKAIAKDSKELAAFEKDIRELQTTQAQIVALAMEKQQKEIYLAWQEELKRQQGEADRLRREENDAAIDRVKQRSAELWESKRQYALHMLDQFNTEGDWDELRQTPFNQTGFAAIDQLRAQNQNDWRFNRDEPGAPRSSRSAGATAQQPVKINQADLPPVMVEAFKGIVGFMRDNKNSVLLRLLGDAARSLKKIENQAPGTEGF